MGKLVLLKASDIASKISDTSKIAGNFDKLSRVNWLYKPKRVAATGIEPVTQGL
jgi:hypothetical protein